MYSTELYDTMPAIETTSSMAMGAGLIVYFVIIMAVAVVSIIAMWKIFTKAGKPGWAAIVPVYNMEKYLDKCLDALLLQTSNDYEIILVNDGSTDNTIELLSRYPFIEIRYFNTNNSFDDNAILEIKNTVWRDYIDEYDWCIVCDFDEVLYSERNFKPQLALSMYISSLFTL